MSDTYAILGFFDTPSAPVVLYESDSFSDCKRWKEGYTKQGDWGGYEALALYEIGQHQSAETIVKEDSPILIWDRP
jgi:hypothetical protein